MNFKKLSLLIFFSIAAFPAIANARPAQKAPVVHQAVRRGSIGRFFHRLGQPSR